MSLEVYKLTVHMGLRKDLGTVQTANVFYFRVDNSAGLNSYEAARDLSERLRSTFGWVSFWKLLFNIATRFRKWQVVRVLPSPGATYDDTIAMYDQAGLRFVTSGIRYLTANCCWIVDDAHARLPYNQIGLVAKDDFDDDQIWIPYLIQIGDWANVHVASDITDAGNPFYSVCRRQGNDIVEITGFRINDAPGRRITRREVR